MFRLTFVTAWTHALTEDDQQIAGWLLEHGYELLWGQRSSGEVSLEPFESGDCWFEIWRGAELLSFAGPFVCPISAEVIEAMGQLIFRQALELAKARDLR